MTPPVPHASFEELAVGHALSALEPHEEEIFLVHLRSCARCERDLQVHRETAAHLAYAAAPAEPPASILAALRAVTGGPVAAPLAPVVELAPRRRAPVPAWAGIAAAAALVVSLGVWNLDLRSDKADSAEYSGRLAAAVQALEVPGTRAVHLETGDAVSAVALVRGREVQLVVDGLAPNDRERSTYVLWSKGRYGKTLPAGTFDVRHAGAHLVGSLSLSTDDVSALMVTLERGRTVPDAASAPVLAFGTLA